MREFSVDARYQLSTNHFLIFVLQFRIEADDRPRSSRYDYPPVR